MFDSLRRGAVAAAFSSLLALTSTAAFAVQEDAGAALRAAASRGDADTVRSLIASGTAVDAANEYGATPLIVASMRGHAEVVAALLESGADPDLADTFYRLPPIGWAANAGHAAIVSLLFGAGGGGFDTLFNDAVGSGDVERVAELLALHVPTAEVLSAALQQAIGTQNRPLGELLASAGAVPPPPEILSLDAAVLRRYEGLYVDEVGYELDVRLDVDTNTLMVRPSGMRNALRFLPVEETTFISEQSEAIFVRFIVREGVVVSMTFTQPGDTRRMTRR